MTAQGVQSTAQVVQSDCTSCAVDCSGLNKCSQGPSGNSYGYQLPPGARGSSQAGIIVEDPSVEVAKGSPLQLVAIRRLKRGVQSRRAVFRK